MDKIYLGNTTEYGRLYLSKHSWDCGWYWGFGYIGNSRLHMHIDSLIGTESNVDKIFDKGFCTYETIDMHMQPTIPDIPETPISAAVP